MKTTVWIGSALLLVTVTGIGAGLAAWKYDAMQAADAASANQPEPMETVTVAIAKQRAYRPTTTSIGTVLALRSITLRNEVPGTVQHVDLAPGQIVDAGTVLVALDVSVEQAELRAQQAQSALAQTMLERMQHLSQNRAVSETEVDQALAERDVALAQVARIEAIIARKTIRAPFRARIGLADVHPGQYLGQGTRLTTLQGVADAAHVDFQVAQQVAASLHVGDTVEIFMGDSSPAMASIVAIDPRIDPLTRNATVRARVEGAPRAGASVRVSVPVGPSHMAVAIPVNALRKSPAGDHVFVIARDERGKPRAQLRPVESGEVLGDQVLIRMGIAAGERVAASGSFKLNDETLVAIANDSALVASRTR
ncbi:MAG: efflux RND transporter periplasmic adaptor subunit [Gammaproteobacteria bacterium]|nr:efflux RND transporter periplasmic adaptor subunit [Gammaproteobacteria bacterium]